MKKLSMLMYCMAVIICVTAGCANQTPLKEADLEYQITADCNNLAEHVNALLGQEGRTLYKVQGVYNWIDLEEKRIVLIEVDVPSEQSRLGIAELELGPNGQYKLGFISHSTQNIQCEITEGKDNEYFLIAGRNQGNMLRKIISTEDGKSFSVEIPESEQFLVAIPTEDAKKLWEFDSNSWRFYNAAGEDITSEIEW